MLLRQNQTVIILERFLIFLFLGTELIFLLGVFFGSPWNLGAILIAVSFAVLLIFLKPYLGLLACTFLLFSTVGTVFLQSLFKPLLLLTLTAWFLAALRSGEFNFSRSSQDLAIVAFFIVALLSALVARNLGRTAELTNEYLRVVFFYYAMIVIVSSRQEVKWFIWSMLIAGAISGCMAIYFTFWGDQSGAGVNLISVLTSRTENVAHDPNYLALATVPLIPFAIAMLKIERGVLARLSLIIFTLLFIATTVLTFSRMGLLCLLIVLIMFLYYERKQKAVVLIASSTLLLLIFAIPDYILKNIRTLQDFSGDVSVIQRLRILKGGINMFLDHPVLGVGLGNFLTESLHYTQTILPRLAHNTYLEIAAEMGALGLIAFIALVWFTLKDMNTLERIYAQRDEHFLQLIRYTRMSFVVFLVGAFFLTAGPLFTFWTPVALTVIMKNLLKKENQRTLRSENL